jgi:hypothetical protein
MRCSVLTRSLLPRMRRDEGETSIRSIVRPHTYKTGYWLRQILSQQFFCVAGAGDQGHRVADVLGNEWVVT